MTSDSTSSANEELLARGGGNATAAGVSFQAQLGAAFASQLLAERQIDSRLGLVNACVQSLRFETEAPVDDILIETDKGGWVFVQAKTSLTLSKRSDSEIGKTAEQIVRLWLTCSCGTGHRGWDRPLRSNIDRILLAVGPSSSAPVVTHLARALCAAQATSSAPLPINQQEALDTFVELIRRAWVKIEGHQPDEATTYSVLRYITILPFDLAGPDRVSAQETLAHALHNSSDTNSAFSVLAQRCADLMRDRLGTDAVGFRQALAAANIVLLAPPSFIADVANLLGYSERIQFHLNQYEETKIGDEQIKIERPCIRAVADAALTGSLLLVGDPGAGKSAVISAAARRLRQEGYDVIELAVDRLPVESLEGLRQELGLTHSFADILINWPGNRPAILFIDALDATRGGAGESVFRTLIGDVLALGDRRWRIVASIRTFDLRLGEEFRDLFKGRPPNGAFADLSYSDVRHVHVPAWSLDEFNDLLAQAPRIGAAIAAGGERLRDLALVPFNTRLLADLISGGCDPNAFDKITSQVELLALYWRHRVERHGTAMELCLRAAVSEMIATRTLSARKLETAQVNSTAFDKLLTENVLILLRGDRFVAFRHHILFDYAASRLYLHPDDLNATASLLESNRGLGLMLAPALAFALQNLWNDTDDGHERFWDAVGRFSGDPLCDPIARSVSARAASELPQKPEDIGGLLAGLSAEGIRKTHAAVAFGHVVGALAVRVEDKQTIIKAPWCELAARAAVHVASVLWPLRTLLYLLVEKVDSEIHRNQLGHAARAILGYALDHQDTPSQFIAAAVEFVAATYASDIAASRDLLRRLLAPERFQAHADQELPWLSRKIKPISEVDPDFVVEIYRVIFGNEISDTGSTSIGSSQILPITSNRRQDYGMAQFSLKEFFPQFLQLHPNHAVTALMHAMSGYIARAHPIPENAGLWMIAGTGRKVVLREDLSHIWAWNTREEHGDNTLGLLKAFVNHLRTAAPTETRAMVQQLVSQNELAVIWTRTLLVAAERPDVIGDILWPLAIKEPFVNCLDTIKDAVDFIAARYPYESEAERETMERDALAFAFSLSRDPENARQHVLKRLFCRIGASNLLTSEARLFVPADQAASRLVQNPRPYEIISGVSSGDDSFWWLRHSGVDIDAPENAQLLAETKEVKSAFGLEIANSRIADLAGAVESLKRLYENAAKIEVTPEVAEYARGIVGQGINKVSGFPDSELKAKKQTIDQLIPLLENLATSPSPEMTADAEASFEKSPSWGSPAPRIEAAQAIMNLTRIDVVHVEYFRSTIEKLLIDPHPAVRMQIADRLTSLWVTDQPWMWTLAESISRHETNRSVLKFFANNFLGRVVHHAPDRVEALTLMLCAREFPRSAAATEGLLEEIGSLTASLWIGHGCESARESLKEWLADAPTFEPELGHAIFVTREPLVLRYVASEERNVMITRRAQEFAAWTVEATANGLEGYLTNVAGSIPTDADKVRGTTFVRLLNEISDQFYFASGAFESHNQNEPGLTTVDAKAAFLSDTYSILHRIADAGTPPTIYHLIELLEFLIPADPPRVFDLVAHALLGAGKRHGYQFESLGADRFVTIIGRFLADFRDIFINEERQRNLIACLDAFMEAGWPAARRLLYRLPELLQ